MRTNRLPAIIVLALLLPGASSAVGSVDRVVQQKGRVFSVGEMSVTRLEPVVFLNDDTVPHNVMSTSAGNAFDLGSQAPGSATPVSFSVAGTVVVICAIHPRMHMRIMVAE
jgi:plastocyanin